MILSYWAGPAVAHTLVSFGFEGGEQVVFTVEIRRRRGQLFSEIGGFFKMYELSIVAPRPRRDAVRVRTNVRGEDDYLYRVRMAPEQIRSLFLAYVEAANRLVDAPRFYNTITANCTTIIYQMVTRIVGRLPLSPRLLLSGYLAEYVHAIGGLDQRHTVFELRAIGSHHRSRACAADQSPAFSAGNTPRDSRARLTSAACDRVVRHEACPRTARKLSRWSRPAPRRCDAGARHSRRKLRLPHAGALP